MGQRRGSLRRIRLQTQRRPLRSRIRRRPHGLSWHAVTRTTLNLPIPFIMKTTAIILTFSIIVPFLAAKPDKHWPAWRGPNANGSSAGGSYPATWSDTKNVIWKAALPGKGCSTPAVWDESILLTCAAKGQDAVLAFDWNGKKLWQTEVGPERKGKHRNGSGSNPSVVTCLLYTSPSPRDATLSRMPSSA